MKFIVIPVKISGNMSDLAWDKPQILRREAENCQKKVCVHNVFSTID